MSTLQVLLDTPQSRIVRSRLATTVLGELRNARGEDINGWVSPADDNCFIEPTKRRLMLCPAPFLAAWQTSTGGIYTRLQVSDLRSYSGGVLSALSGTDWKTVADRASGDYWIKLAKSTSNPDLTIATNATYDQNRGFYLEQFNYAASQDKGTYTECGWYAGAETPDTGSIKLRLYQSGEIWVYRFGELVAKGERSGPAQASAKPLEKIGYVLLPIPPRDIVVLTSDGQGFAHPLDDIEEDDTDPVITTDASHFWVRHPAPQDIKFQIAPLSFPSSGYASGVKSVFQEPPPSGESPTLTTIYNVPGYGTDPTVTAELKELNSSTDFVPDGTEVECQVRVTLTGDGTNTPFVHAAIAEFDPGTDDTADVGIDIGDYLLEFSLDVPESMSGLEASLTLKDPEGLEDAGAAQIRDISNRPITVSVGGWTILNGILGPPKFTDAAYSAIQRLSFEARDWCKMLETELLPDDVVHDGGDLRDELIRLLKLGAVKESDIFCDDPAYTLPVSQSPSKGEFSVVTSAGSSVMEGFTNLIEGYCPNWFTGVLPNAGTVEYQILDPENFGEEPAITLYRTIEDAVDVGGYDERDAWMFVVRDWTQEVIEPEANDIWVTGLDKRTQRPIVVHYPDRDSQDPSLSPELRPLNWIGGVRRYGLYDPNLSTMDACIRAAELLYKRLTPRRILDDWNAEVLLWPDEYMIWRSALVGIYDALETKKTRVMRLSGAWELDPTADDDTNLGARWRSLHYVSDRLEDPTMTTGRYGYIGRTARAIRESQALRLARPTVIYRNGGQRLEGLRPQEVITLPL